MGAVLQTAGVAELAAEVTCCACSSICGLAARDSATRAKFRYCSFLLLATVTCIIALIPGLRARLDKIPNLCTKVFSPETCDTFVGFSAVYRILFAMAVFHFILSVLTVKVTRIKSFRAKFNNGLWMFKLGLIFGLTIATFYIPKRSGFFRIWMYLSLTGGFMFVMFQIILVIDFGHSWSLSWAEKLETGNTKLWYCTLGLTTFFMFAISFGAILSFYAFFTPHVMKCHANFFYISFMTIQCIIATVISVTPSVQNQLPGAGLLQSSVVVLYALYLTWNTLSSEPDSLCNPLGNIILEYDSFTGLSGEAIFGCLLTLTLLIFACTVRADTSHLGKYGLALTESEDFALATYYEDHSKVKVEKELENGNKEVLLSEYVGYNYSFFHIIMSLASLHILMVLTNWHSPEEHSNMKTLVKNWLSVWVQMASSFSCILMYVWFLVTPLVKKVWGPVFGVEMDDEIMMQKAYPLKSYKNEPRGAKEKRAIQNNTKNVSNLLPRSKTDELVNQQKSTNASYENLQRPTAVSRAVSKNTYCPSDVSYTQQQQQQQPTFRNMSIESLNYQSHISHQATTNNKAQKGHTLKPPTMRLHCADDYTTDNTLSQNGFHNDEISNIQKRRQYTKHYKHRFFRHENMNTSIESINSWVSNSYRRKYQPLITNNKQDEQLTAMKDNNSVFDQLALIEDESVEKDAPFCSQMQNSSNRLDNQPRKVQNKLNNSCRSELGAHQQRHNEEKSPRKRTPTKTPNKIANKETQETIPGGHHLPPSGKTQRVKNKSSHDTLPNRKYEKRHITNITSTNYENTCSRADDSSDSSPNNAARRKKKRKKKTPKHSNRQPTTMQDSKIASYHLQNAGNKLPYNTATTRTNYYDNTKHSSKTNRQNSYLSDKSRNEREWERTPVLTTCKNKSLRNSTASFASMKYRSSSTLYTKIKTQQSCEETFDHTLELTKQSPKKPANLVKKVSSKPSRRQDMPVSGYVTQDVSVVPSVFKRKPQDCTTANELLKLQWKILRTQAKIVKIQERIYRLQSNEDGEDEQQQKHVEKNYGDILQTRNGNDTKQKNYKRRRRKSTMN